MGILVRKVDGASMTWRLEEDYYRYWDGKNVTALVGMETDLASIPKGLRSIVSVVGKYANAAVLHDWLYRGNNWDDGQKATRKEADKMFRDLMIEDGEKVWRAKLMYAAVRVGGVFSWKKR